MPERSERLSARTFSVTLIFVVGCLLSSARLLYDAPSVHRRTADLVAQRSDLRFASLKAQLPSRGTVGYIGESSDSVADYYLAQYALAPLVLDHSTNHPLVVGNFPVSTPGFPEGDLQLVQDFGDGVLLLQRRDQE